jgi:hypothetical protein
MSAVYGYEPSSRDDPLVQVVETAQEIGITMMTPERAMVVRIFPFCELNVFDEKYLYAF